MYDYPNKLVKYTVKYKPGSIFGFNKERVYLIDTMGKFNFGDTIKLTK
jgi:hypothetical protein